MFIIEYIKNLRKGFKNVSRSSKNGEDYRLRQDMKNKTKKEFSLYGEKEVSKSAKRHHWIHYVFKYKILMPVFYALEKGFEKYFYEPTNEWYDEVFNTINKSVEEGTYEWAKYYIGINKNWKEKDIEKYVKNSPFMRMFRLGQLGIVGNDSAYRELENIIAFKLVNNFNKKFGDKKEWNHLMYTSPTIYDVNYYFAGYDLLNRYFIKSETNGEEKILATETLPHGHKKVYFTLNLQNLKGWTNIFKELQRCLESIPKNYIITHLHMNAMGINNIEVIVFDKDMPPTEVEVQDNRGRDIKNGNN